MIFPPLPEPGYRKLSDLQSGIDSYYTSDQLRKYGLKCVEEYKRCQSKQEWDIRGDLASSLKCWHRLTGEEAAELVEFALALLEQAQPVALPLAPPNKLNELADRIDHEQLWRWAGMDHDKMTPEQKDRMNAGVHLRRYASLLGGEYWRIYPPKPGLRYMADTLDEVVAMARKGGIGGKL